MSRTHLRAFSILGTLIIPAQTVALSHRYGGSSFVLLHNVNLSCNIGASQAITILGINFTGDTNVPAETGSPTPARSTSTAGQWP